MGRGGGFPYFFSIFIFFSLLERESAAAESAAAKKTKTPELKLFILFKKARQVRRSASAADWPRFSAPKASKTDKNEKI